MHIDEAKMEIFPVLCLFSAETDGLDGLTSLLSPVNVALQSWNEISYTFYPGRYMFRGEGNSCGSSLELFHHWNEQ